MSHSSLRNDLNEAVRLYFTPITAIAREFKKALDRRAATSAADVEERASLLRKREVDLARKMLRMEKAIAEQRRSLERQSN